MTTRRPLALSAAAIIGFSGLFIASPAIAVNDESTTNEPQQGSAIEVPETAPVEEAETLEAAGVEIVAFGVNANGEATLVTTEESSTSPRAERAIDAFASQFGAEDELLVQTVATRPVAFGADDVVGGAGYLIGTADSYVGNCSLGFAAWSASSQPIFLSAGHCAMDGEALDATLSTPSVQPANTGDRDSGNDASAIGELLGDFGFSQFGGIGNSPYNPDDFEFDGSLKPGAEPDPEATDISVIEGLNPDLNALPQVTTWTTADSDDLSADTVKVKTAGGNPSLGQIEKSGRTTGFTSGTVDANSIIDGWTIIEDRWVRGFQSDIVAAPGDSGGAVLQGNNALGVISGGIEAADNNGEQWTWTASLDRALPHLPAGTEIALDIDAPTASIAADATIAGGSQIVISLPSNATALSVNDGSGAVSHTPTSNQVSLVAPGTPGDYEYPLTAVNGKSSSKTVKITFTVRLGAPTANNIDTTVSAVTVTGTGAVGAEVTLAGDVTGTATVDAEGNWSVSATLEIGEYDFTAEQQLNGQTSDQAEGKVVVRPVAPAITSPENGAVFAYDEGPEQISGTGIKDATVTLTVNGVTHTAVVDENGEWAVELDSALASGTYTLSAVQRINSVNSAAVEAEFNVAADPSQPVPPVDNGNTESTTTENNTGDSGLANTGASTLLPLGISALLMLALGGGLFALTLRRKSANSEI